MDKRIIRTREAIRRAYCELLTESSDGKVTVTDIANKADIDRKTFYLHYKSVDDLMSNFSKKTIDSLYERLQGMPFFESPYDKTAIFRAITEVIESEENFYRMLASSKNCDFFWKEIEDALVKLIIDVYEPKGICSKSELNICGRFFMAGTIKIYKSWLRGEMDISPEEIENIAGEVSFRGIQGIVENKKGRKVSKYIL